MTVDHRQRPLISSGRRNPCSIGIPELRASPAAAVTAEWPGSQDRLGHALCCMHEADDHHAAGLRRRAAQTRSAAPGPVDRSGRSRGDTAGPAAASRRAPGLLRDRGRLTGGRLGARRRARRRQRGDANAAAGKRVLIVDAGPLYAAAARRDKHHERVSAAALDRREAAADPALVLTEVSDREATGSALTLSCVRPTARRRRTRGRAGAHRLGTDRGTDAGVSLSAGWDGRRIGHRAGRATQPRGHRQPETYVTSGVRQTVTHKGFHASSVKWAAARRPWVEHATRLRENPCFWNRWM